jgi:hypothetical protein
LDLALVNRLRRSSKDAVSFGMIWVVL